MKMELPVLISIVSYLVLVVGLILKRKRIIHVILMHIGILTNIGLVIALQIQRSAVQTVLEFGLTIPQQIHVYASLAAIILYIPTMLLGWARFLTQSKDRATILALQKKHRNFALTAFTLHTVGIIFIYSMGEI